MTARARVVPDWFVPVPAPALPAYIPRIPRRAMNAWVELSAALAADAAVVPCSSVAREWWTSDDQKERATAAVACIGCTAIEKCSSYADLAGIQFHVYGGTDRSVSKTTSSKEVSK